MMSLAHSILDYSPTWTSLSTLQPIHVHSITYARRAIRNAKGLAIDPKGEESI